MNVRRYSGKGLKTLARASEAEGFGFVSRLVGEFEEGVYEAPGSLLLGAYGANELRGVCGLMPDPYLGAATLPVGRVRHLYVLPEHRREGVGRALLEAIVAAARSHNARLRLRTNTARGSAFYLSLGFVETCEPDATHVLDLEP